MFDFFRVRFCFSSKKTFVNVNKYKSGKRISAQEWKMFGKENMQ